jgi:hypothetical protein
MELFQRMLDKPQNEMLKKASALFALEMYRGVQIEKPPPDSWTAAALLIERSANSWDWPSPNASEALLELLSKGEEKDPLYRAIQILVIRTLPACSYLV